jgi:hypothetical protein
VVNEKKPDEGADSGVAIPEGIVPEPENRPIDAPTLVVDGLIGVTASPYVTKIHLTEHFPGPNGRVAARYVVNLAVPTDQFIKLANSMKEVADQIVSQLPSQES